MGKTIPAGYSLARGLPNENLIYWDLRRSDELFQLIYGKALTASTRADGEVPVYGTNGRCGSHNEALFKGPGVIIGRKGQGPLGVEYCKEDYWVIDTAYTLSIRGDVLLEYAYYMIKYVGLNHLKDGSSNPTLSRDSFGRQMFPLPPMAHQKAIARVLGTIDDKIELNRKTNETLEAIAKALFKSWFVDFDPVRAKAEGRPTGLPDDISALFPDSFEGSELGEIPQGWTVQKLGEVCSVNTGKRPNKVEGEKSVACPVPLYGGAGIMGFTSEPLLETFPAIITGRVGTLGILNRVYSPCWASDNTLVILPKPREFDYFYHSLSLIDLKGLNRGSTQPLLSQTELKNVQFVVANHRVIHAFDGFTEPMRINTTNLLRQSEILAEVRDTLLPRLISGELRVPEAEAFLAEAPL